MTAGRLLRDLQRKADCPICGHADADHHERPYGSAGYAPAVFFCSRCDCSRDLRQGR